MKHLRHLKHILKIYSKAVGIEQEMTLMDKSIDKDLSQEEVEELEEDIE